MANATLLGVQELDFETKEGNTIKGIKLHISYNDPFVYGAKADTKFLSDSLCRNIGLTASELKELVGGEIELEMNPDGKLVGISG